MWYYNYVMSMMKLLFYVLHKNLLHFIEIFSLFITADHKTFFSLLNINNNTIYDLKLIIVVLD